MLVSSSDIQQLPAAGRSVLRLPVAVRSDLQRLPAAGRSYFHWLPASGRYSPSGFQPLDSPGGFQPTMVSSGDVLPDVLVLPASSEAVSKDTPLRSSSTPSTGSYMYSRGSPALLHQLQCKIQSSQPPHNIQCTRPFQATRFSSIAFQFARSSSVDFQAARFSSVDFQATSSSFFAF